MLATAAIVPGHYASEEQVARALARLGKPAAAALILGKLPTTKGIRSGDLGEIYATEWIDALDAGRKARGLSGHYAAEVVSDRLVDRNTPIVELRHAAEVLSSSAVLEQIIDGCCEVGCPNNRRLSKLHTSPFSNQD